MHAQNEGELKLFLAEQNNKYLGLERLHQGRPDLQRGSDMMR